ncbi:MAG: hypothetical protein MJA83_18125 [Gammaproteobacteria bacterium]|nr:hypothetical protein [Gammaproteobacteria bacterium]
MTQYLAVITDGRAYPFIPLSWDDGEDVFGLQPSFKETIATLPQVEDPNVCIVASNLIEAAFEDRSRMTVEEILGDVSNKVIKGVDQSDTVTCEIEDVTQSEVSEDEDCDDDCPDNVKKRRRRNQLQGHYTGRQSHQRKDGFAMKHRRYQKNGLLSIWSSTFDRLSDKFNPVEKNLLRSVSLNVGREDDHSKSLAEIDFENYPFGTLYKLWNIIVSGGQNNLVRQKTRGALKEELQKMVGIEKFRAKLSVPKGSREKSIMAALLSAGQEMHCDVQTGHEGAHGTTEGGADLILTDPPSTDHLNTTQTNTVCLR